MANIHNAITWAKRKTVDRAFIKEGIMVWCGFLNDKIVGPYIFEQGTVTGKSYLEMLKRLCPYLQSSLDDEIIFQQDGAPSHYFHEVTDWLNNTFKDRWMGRGVPIPWPARSPDLTPLDFWLWGYLKEIVYTQSPKTIPDLKQAISDAISQIPNQMVQSATKCVTKRAQKIVDVLGLHIENHF